MYVQYHIGALQQSPILHCCAAKSAHARLLVHLFVSKSLGFSQCPSPQVIFTICPTPPIALHPTKCLQYHAMPRSIRKATMLVSSPDRRRLSRRTAHAPNGHFPCISYSSGRYCGINRGLMTCACGDSPSLCNQRSYIHISRSKKWAGGNTTSAGQPAYKARNSC